MTSQTLQNRLMVLSNLRNKRDVMAHRFYNSENQAILIEMIIDEIKDMDKTLPHDLYANLLNPNKLATQDIHDLCQIFKRVILHNVGKGI